jgi:hypothetical protein
MADGELLKAFQERGFKTEERLLDMVEKLALQNRTPLAELSWSDVMWARIKRGYPREEAAHQADEFMRRRYRERVRELQQFARSIKK